MAVGEELAPTNCHLSTCKMKSALIVLALALSSDALTEREELAAAVNTAKTTVRISEHFTPLLH